jgi:HK97 family phage major capsid protein
MKTVEELKQERATVFAEAEEILDLADENDRELSEDEETRYNACLARIEVLSTDITRRMKLEEAQIARMAQEGGKPTRVPQSGGHPDGMPADPPPAAAAASAAGMIPRSYGKLVAFPKTKEGEARAYRAGMFIRASIYGDIKAADWCRQHGVGIRSALSGGVNTAGGVLVPEEFERAIIDLREEYGVFRRLVRVRPMGSDTQNIPRRTGGLTAYYVGENTAGTESDAAWDNVQLTAKKLMVLTRMSSEVSDDAIIDLADTMAQEIAYAFAVKEDTVGFTGTGISTDGGIVGVNVKAIDGSHGMANVAAASGHDTLPEIDADDLITLMAAVPKYAKRGSSWVCSPTAEELVFNAIKVGGGGNTRDILSDSDTPRFLGYPIEVTDVYPDSATTNYNGAVMIGFGNLQQAVSLGDRRGIRVGLSSERYWAEDQIGVKGTMRHDINVHDLGSGSVKSPFCVLTGTT